MSTAARGRFVTLLIAVLAVVLAVLVVPGHQSGPAVHRPAVQQPHRVSLPPYHITLASQHVWYAPHGIGSMCDNAAVQQAACGNRATQFYSSARQLKTWAIRDTKFGPTWRTSYGILTIRSFGSHGYAHVHVACGQQCTLKDKAGRNFTVDAQFRREHADSPLFNPNAAKRGSCGGVFDFWNWCWSDILGWPFNNLIKPCISGAIDPVLGASGVFLWALLARGDLAAVLARNPEALPGLMLGACFIAIFHHWVPNKQ